MPSRQFPAATRPIVRASLSTLSRLHRNIRCKGKGRIRPIDFESEGRSFESCWVHQSLSKTPYHFCPQFVFEAAWAFCVCACVHLECSCETQDSTFSAKS